MAATATREEHLLRAMVDIPSVSGSESELAAYLAGTATRWGLRGHVDGAGNFVAHRGPADAPGIMLVGHMDTVPGGPPARQDGPILRGRGTIDAKGPLAAMLCAAARADLGGVPVTVAGTVQEETTGHGAEHLGRTHRPRFALIGEPNGWAGVGIGYKGRVCLRYEVDRPASHTAGPAEKATEAALAFWNRLAAHLETFAPEKGAFHRPIATPYEIGGTIEHAMLDIWCRTPPGFDLDAFERFVADAAGDARVTIGDRTPGVQVARDAPTVTALCSGIRASGGQPRLKLKTGTADLNVVSRYWQIPMAVYGPGDSALDHTDDEHIDLREFATSIEVLTHALEQLAGEVRREEREAAEAAAGAAAAGSRPASMRATRIRAR